MSVSIAAGSDFGKMIDQTMYSITEISKPVSAVIDKRIIFLGVYARLSSRSLRGPAVFFMKRLQLLRV